MQTFTRTVAFAMTIALGCGIVRAEVSAERFFRIYDQGIGEYEPWYINDHCFMRGQDGLWHMFGITDRYPVNQHSRALAHATATKRVQPRVA